MTITDALVAAQATPPDTGNFQLKGTHMRYDNGMPVLHMQGISRRAIPRIWTLFASIAIAAALAYLLRRNFMLRNLARAYRREDLGGDIARFYDVRSAAWERVWGEHMHHGLYDSVNGQVLKGRHAQVRTMTELLQFGNVHARLEGRDTEAAPRILDAGCGIGGASRFLAREFIEDDAFVTGITLSPVQAARGNDISRLHGLDDRVSLQVADAMKMDERFGNGDFDLVWSLESAEHMDDKREFISACTNVLQPGGTFLMLAWCIRETTPSLSLAEQFSMRKIMEQYCLPRVAPPSEYSTEMLRAGLFDVRVEDWTERAAPFWNEVVRSAVLNKEGWAVLREYGWPLVQSALAMRHVIAGIRLGVFRLVAFTGAKPTAEDLIRLEKLEVHC